MVEFAAVCLVFRQGRAYGDNVA